MRIAPTQSLIRPRRSARLRVGIAFGLLSAATFQTATADITDRRGVPCIDVSFSPNVLEDGIGFCAELILTDAGQASFRIYKTIDRGRSWTQVPAVGLTPVFGDSLGKVVVSPNFDTDEAVFVQTGGGLFRSTDGGLTFKLIDQLAADSSQGENLFAYSETSMLAGATTVFALSRPLPAKVDPPRHWPIAASPFDDVNFLFPPSFDEMGGFVIAAETDSSELQRPRSRARLFACDPALACVRPLFTFPWGTYPETAVLAPDFEYSHRIFALLRTQPPSRHDPYQMWISDDAGLTFRPWESVEQLITEVEKGSNARVGIAVNPDVPNRIYLRLHYARVRVPRDAPPTDQIFRSSNGGETWRRVASSDRNLPWFFPHPLEQPWRMLILSSDGHLFTSAIGYDYEGLYCSVDEGKTWRKTCSPVTGE